MTTQNVVSLHKTHNFPKHLLGFINLMHMKCIHLILRRGFAKLPDHVFYSTFQSFEATSPLVCFSPLALQNNRREKDEWASPGVRRSDFRLQPGLLQLLSQWQSISGMKPGEQAAAVTSRGDRRGETV